MPLTVSSLGTDEEDTGNSAGDIVMITEGYNGHF